MIFQLVLTIALFGASHAFPGGAPTAACSNLTPAEASHGATPSEADSPYTITTNMDEYEAEGDVMSKYPGICSTQRFR